MIPARPFPAVLWGYPRVVVADRVKCYWEECMTRVGTRYGKLAICHRHALEAELERAAQYRRPVR